jgi:hypothetical protein
MQSDRLLGPALSDVDGNTEQRVSTISVFNGPPPTIRVLANTADESRLVGTWLVDLGKASVLPHEMGIFVRSPAVMACDDEIMPLQARIETVADAADLEEVYNTERYLLYVACTRARDHLLVTSVDPASEFLDDLRL